MDLISRQAVIDELHKHFNGGFEEDRWWNSIHVLAAINKVPSAEPHTFRVIDTKTKEEADTYNIALKEEWAKGLCYCDIDMFVIGEDGTLMLIDDCGKCAYCPQGRFEVKWHE